MKTLAKLMKDESGAAAIEYVLICGLVAVAVIGTLGLIGDNLDRILTEINTTLDGVNPATPTP